jgi:site-specific recombinase XerD
MHAQEMFSRKGEQDEITPFSERSIADWIADYRVALEGRDALTIDAYLRVVRQFAVWLCERPGNDGAFDPHSITRTAVDLYLSTLKSTSHKNLARSALSSFCTWLMEEHGLLTKNPTRGIHIAPQAVLAPRVLSEDQRQVVRELVERECEDTGDLRGVAAFALGYWGGCRVSDVSWLEMDKLHVTTKAGSMIVGHKGGKQREVDLTNEARRALLDYLTEGERKESAYVFTSQRAKKTLAPGEIDGWRWSENGIHVWWQDIKQKARRAEAELINDITFHDLRHDFAHRARAAGWSLEEVAYYLGHITKAGTPAIQTTIRYTQVSREQVKHKLKLLTG